MDEWMDGWMGVHRYIILVRDTPIRGSRWGSPTPPGTAAVDSQSKQNDRDRKVFPTVPETRVANRNDWSLPLGCHRISEGLNPIGPSRAVHRPGMSSERTRDTRAGRKKNVPLSRPSVLLAQPRAERESPKPARAIQQRLPRTFEEPRDGESRTRHHFAEIPRGLARKGLCRNRGVSRYRL